MVPNVVADFPTFVDCPEPLKFSDFSLSDVDLCAGFSMTTTILDVMEGRVFRSVSGSAASLSEMDEFG